MNRETMRDLLRRRINEVTPDHWSDNNLNDVLNQAAIQLQKRAVRMNKELLVSIQRTSVTKDDPFIPKPQGLWYVQEVGWLDSETGKYKQLRRKNFQFLRNRYQERTSDTNTGLTRYYSEIGRFFYVDPPPEETVVDQLQVLYMPTMTMSDDAEVLQVPQPLLYPVVLIAQRIALGETGDPEGKVKDEIEEHINDIPNWFLKSADEASDLNIDALSIGRSS